MLSVLNIKFTHTKKYITVCMFNDNFSSKFMENDIYKINITFLYKCIKQINWAIATELGTLSRYFVCSKDKKG